MAAKNTLDGTIFRVGIIFTASIGALSLVGPIVMWAPSLLLGIALLCSVWELRVSSRRYNWRNSTTCVLFSLAIASFAFFFYVTWFVFVIHMQVRFITGNAVGRDHEELRFAVKLTNVGRATSLTSWRASLTMPDGHKVEGEIKEIAGETIAIEGADHISNKYVVPDCDLTFETVRAVQTGDSIYGIIIFNFAIPSNQPVPMETKVVLQAEDMLGRVISDRPIRFGDINSLHRDVFPCHSKP